MKASKERQTLGPVIMSLPQRTKFRRNQIMSLKHTQEGTVVGMASRDPNEREKMLGTCMDNKVLATIRTGGSTRPSGHTHTHTPQARRSSKPKGHILGQSIKLLVAGLTQEEWKCLG